MSRLERLLNLTAALLNTDRPLTAAELREQVPGYPEGDKATFRRAFERDKEALRDMGIPVLTTEISGSEPPEPGYRIRRADYALRDPGLTPDELAAVHLAIAGVRMEGLPGTAAIWKLGGATSDATSGPAVAALPAIPQLVPVFGAVAQRAPIRFAYRGEPRHVDPYRLSVSRGRWYLDGFDHDRGELRQFRLDRMDGDVEMGSAESFDRPATDEGGLRQPWELGDEPPVTARVRIDVDQAGWAVDHLGEDRVVTRDDAGVVVELVVTNRDAFRSFVLGFLDHAEVLDPPALRDELVGWLEAIAS